MLILIVNAYTEARILQSQQQRARASVMLLRFTCSESASRLRAHMTFIRMDVCVCVPMQTQDKKMLLWTSNATSTSLCLNVYYWRDI